MRMVKILSLLFLIVVLSPRLSTAQPTIGGIINDYTPVISITSADCSSSITVQSTIGFAVGDEILLIQMQGASIVLAPSTTFGSINSYGGAGLYEFNRIKKITGTTIELDQVIGRPFNVAGKVQLVRVPEFSDVKVSNQLTCKAWDGSTGGVLVFFASGKVTVEAPITVKGKGFLGGAYVRMEYHCGHTQYYCSNSEIDGTSKGEGIWISYDGFQRGRGAIANGGGGGNDHNAGGGGGANYGAGGFGGCEWSGCSDRNLDTRGIGGYALDYSTTLNTIYMGGGAGAGHDNDQSATAGGNGGGIVIIQANELTGTNPVIDARGVNADSVLVVGQDGGGGGGAGGAVLLDIKNYSSTLLVKSNGGDGATTIFQGGHVGPGGGGGGGVVWLSQSQIPTGVTGQTSGGKHGIHCKDVAKDGWESTNGAGGLVMTDLVLAVAKGSASTKSSTVFTAGQTTASIKTGDSAGVDLSLSFPTSSAMIGFIPDTVLLTVGFDSKYVRLDSVIQSGGWIVKRITPKGNTAEIAFYNSTHIAIPAAIDFGRMVFTALNALANSSALVYVADMKAESNCSIVTASPDIETAFLRRILVNAAAAVSTDNVLAASSVFLYPNPATNSVRISYGGFTKEPVMLSIVDVTGKTVLTRTLAQQASSEYVVSLEGISSGSYTILIGTTTAHLDIVK
jgi:hypothetical protein